MKNVARVATFKSWGVQDPSDEHPVSDREIEGLKIDLCDIIYIGNSLCLPGTLLLQPL
jgi:hypothetical protein